MKHCILFILLAFEISICKSQVTVSLHPENRKMQTLDFIIKQVNDNLNTDITVTKNTSFGKTETRSSSSVVQVSGQNLLRSFVNIDNTYNATKNREHREHIYDYTDIVNLNDVVSYTIDDEKIRLYTDGNKVTRHLNDMLGGDDIDGTNKSSDLDPANFISITVIGEPNSLLRHQITEALDNLVAANRKNVNK